MPLSRILVTLTCVFGLQFAHADVLPQAQVGIKIPLTKKPTTRPMTVAYVGYLSRYYIADGGLAPMPTRASSCPMVTTISNMPPGTSCKSSSPSTGCSSLS